MEGPVLVWTGEVVGFFYVSLGAFELVEEGGKWAVGGVIIPEGSEVSLVVGVNRLGCNYM